MLQCSSLLKCLKDTRFGMAQHATKAHSLTQDDVKKQEINYHMEQKIMLQHLIANELEF